MKDPRSAIVKESIKILTIASVKYRTGFDNIISKFLDTLFQLAASSTNAIAKSASEGIKTIMENVYSPKVLTKVIENSKQKSSQIKLVCSECLLFALQSFPKSILDFVDSESLQASIRLLVCDTGKIKDTGKECFSAFSDKYPEKTEKFIQSIPVSFKNLAKELKSLQKTFNIESIINFPQNIEISSEEWAVFENLNVFEAVRLAVTHTNFQTSNEIQLESLLEKAENPVKYI